MPIGFLFFFVASLLGDVCLFGGADEAQKAAERVRKQEKAGIKFEKQDWSALMQALSEPVQAAMQQVTTG